MRRRSCYGFVLFLLFFRIGHVHGQSLNVRLDGNQLKISVPQLRFLTGEALQRLHDGASISYVFETAITSGRDGTRLAQATHRFIISYDLWEEKFAIARTDQPPRSVSHLSAAAAEAWCLDSLALPAGGISADMPFWISLEYHAEERQRSSDNRDNSTFTLGRLIDIFSNRSQKQQQRGSREGGPFRLSDLRRSEPHNPGNR